jgi:hypothetical protein
MFAAKPLGDGWDYRWLPGFLNLLTFIPSTGWPFVGVEHYIIISIDMIEYHDIFVADESG